jgi:hypothetical protein
MRQSFVFSHPTKQGHPPQHKDIPGERLSVVGAFQELGFLKKGQPKLRCAFEVTEYSLGGSPMRLSIAVIKLSQVIDSKTDVRPGSGRQVRQSSDQLTVRQILVGSFFTLQ